MGADGKPPASLSTSAGAVLLQVSGHVLALPGRNRNGNGGGVGGGWLGGEGVGVGWGGGGGVAASKLDLVQWIFPHGCLMLCFCIGGTLLFSLPEVHELLAESDSSSVHFKVRLNHIVLGGGWGGGAFLRFITALACLFLVQCI